MNKKLTLLIFLFPMLAIGQVEFKNGGLIFDMGNKKTKAQRDSIENSQRIPDAPDDDDQQKPKKEKKPPAPKPYVAPYDYKKDGIFKALVHAGINGCQIDGDGYAGYNYLGAEAGIGALYRFHKNFSVSMEINYTMKGAKQAFVFTQVPTSLQKYRVSWDYVEIPVGVNIYAKNLMMLSLGFSIAAQVRFQEFSEDGDNETNNPPEGPPNKYDFCGFAGLHFIIHNNYVIGGKFSYSLVKIRGPHSTPGGISQQAGEFNNVLTLRFMYIIDTVKKGNKKKGPGTS
jgi:hypothetical protein